ncbi:MAG: DNA internalization-related competence protein ComEC/Rec2 [Acidobacteriota bacterium]
MPFPFLYLASSLAAGILLSSLLLPSLLLSIGGLFFCLSSAWLAYFLRKDKACLAAALLALLFLGMGLQTRESSEYEKNAVKRFDFNGYADFSGRLFRSPAFGVGRTQLFLRLEKIAYRNREEKARGNLRVTVLHPSIYPSPLRLKVGDRVKVSAQILPARDFRNFGSPRLANLRRNQKIHNHAVTKSPLLVEAQAKENGFSILRRVSSWRQTLQRRIEDHFSLPDRTGLSREGAVLEALLLGERGRMDEATTLALQKSGLFHLIAISGAHIAIISFLFFAVLRLLRTPQRPSYLILIVLLLVYSLLVEGRASVFRATLMAMTYLTGKLLWRQTQLLNAISFSALFLLIANPFYLFDIGFELTFAATLSIILFYPRVLRFLPRLPLRISELFALSLTAQIGVLPFLVSSFNRVTFSALWLNFLAIPLTGVIMGAGFIFLALSLVSSGLASFLAQGLEFLVRIFLWVSRLFDFVPVFSYRIPTPALAVIIGYFLFLGLLLVRPAFKGQKLVVLGLFAALLTILVTYPFPPRSSPALKLTFLDVGQGDSMLVEFPGRKKMLVDGGGVPDASFDIGEHGVSPFLWSKGIKRLDYVVLTHAHPDHLNGLGAVARNFRISEFWEAFSPSQNPIYDNLQKSLPSSVIRRKVFRGWSHQEGEVRIEVYHPEQNGPSSREVRNDDSLVLRLTQGRTTFLLTADIGTAAEEEILERGWDIRSQVLKSPHHGSRSSSSSPFLEEVHPEVVVITAGRGNLYGVPHPEILERYRAVGARVLRTDVDGAIEIMIDGTGLLIRTAHQESRDD